MILRKSTRNGYGTARGGYFDRNYNGNNRTGNYGRLNDNYGGSRYRRSGSYRGTGLEGYDAKKLRKSIDDNWENREFRVRIKIKDTDSGIKMKRDGRRDYTYYLQDFRNPTVFSDSRGNSIEIINRYEIVWYDARNGRSLYFNRD